jgi:hypothetical protein
MKVVSVGDDRSGWTKVRYPRGVRQALGVIGGRLTKSMAEPLVAPSYAAILLRSPGGTLAARLTNLEASASIDSREDQ